MKSDSWVSWFYLFPSAVLISGQFLSSSDPIVFYDKWELIFLHWCNHFWFSTLFSSFVFVGMIIILAFICTFSYLTARLSAGLNWQDATCFQRSCHLMNPRQYWHGRKSSAYKLPQEMGAEWLSSRLHQSPAQTYCGGSFQVAAVFPGGVFSPSSLLETLPLPLHHTHFCAWRSNDGLFCWIVPHNNSMHAYYRTPVYYRFFGHSTEITVIKMNGIIVS